MLNTLKERLYILKTWKYLIFDYPTLSLAEVDYDEYWRAKRGADMGALSDWQLERANYVIRTLAGTTGMSICDIATGEGAIVHHIGNAVHARKLIGTDISDVALERVRAFNIEAIKLDIGDIRELSHIPEADYELLFEILEHVPHSELLLRAAYDKAGKGVFFSFPNTGFFAHRFRLLFGKFPLQWKLFPGEHVRYWTLTDLLWWLTSLGFEQAHIHCYKGVPYLNNLWPSMFAAAFIVYIPKQESAS